MIEARGIFKSFGTVAALRGASFTAPDAQITGLLGPNGAGKTTLLRILATVFKPDGGTALVDGFDAVSSPRAVQSRIGVLPDNRGLYPRLTARENVRYYGRLHGLKGDALEGRIDDLAGWLEMGTLIERRAEGFSQGQRLKVAIARALVHAPGNLLLDEPTNGLDVMSTRALRQFLRRLRDEGCCVLFSSHIMQEIAALCDRIVIIADGAVAAEGTAEQLRTATGKASLEDAFVAVIGSEEGLLL
ncbi:ATP-binding cassette domain-containing protein [Gloeobacter morelensis]|uniref:ATP-binding cassette domain-containing protein n=1 Tax=Gloeobacter morelensis MG652769 TaxID=2781736 RepID=A0ABY3PTU2_9CYAN|nr:ATP-binding cassette domain-containing protein [Gloeobacter morelensis]UFP96903.1 ATP-binding cassette domain-containing protein [Gloeobacter morelensis MG652769]